MRINNNVQALNTYNRLTINNDSLSKSLEKLSSGLRINRAGDDAAGLAISEKMRAQIRGLTQAQRNAQDGISLIQTAEGALNEVHSILQRMRELAVQAANDTATQTDRQEIQKEVDQLAKEITRISNTTEFNTKNLLAGGFNATFHIGANKDQNLTLSISAMDAYSLGVAGSLTTTTFTGTNTGITSISTESDSVNGLYVVAKATSPSTTTVTKTNSNGGAGTVSGIYTGSVDKSFMVKITGVDGSGKVTSAQYSIDGGLSWNNAAVDVSGTDGVVTLTDGLKLQITTNANNASDDLYIFTAQAGYITFGLNTASGGSGTWIGSTVKAYNNQSSVVIGDTGREVTVNFNYTTVATKVGTSYAGDQITQTVVASTAAVVAADGSVTTAAVTQKGINVSSQSNANAAISVIQSAIEKVSAERSKLGALQNRLEHTINNLGTASENLTAAESRIRDVDMAKEMMNYTKNNILMQAATAMLAQANQLPQAVLQLLR